MRISAEDLAAGWQGLVVLGAGRDPPIRGTRFRVHPALSLACRKMYVRSAFCLAGALRRACRAGIHGMRLGLRERLFSRSVGRRIFFWCTDYVLSVF